MFSQSSIISAVSSIFIYVPIDLGGSSPQNTNLFMAAGGGMGIREANTMTITEDVGQVRASGKS
jgi:hypothetical protein